MRTQPIGQVGRLVVSVRLPLERLAARPEEGDGARDQCIDVLLAGEAALADETAIRHVAAPRQRPVPLAGHTSWRPASQRRAHLGVVSSEQVHGHSLPIRAITN